ncbi:GMC family oxidoreductase [Paraburkholderia sp. J67]|uniref:GMC family oxidoreductase n=1 Tax=Paraburkholderia sp. J67 TaxID=2805435 RepID=UPI002ABDE238|nr:GMC family oxidoreductase N-terminal domain-containing protein [Paraburkholderia sp. J67]
MTTTDSQAFDYVVVGAGSAGCALASRLSEDRNVSVLLIEGGGKAPGLFVDLPAAIVQTIRRADLGWGYVSEPEPDLNGRRIEVRRGKVLGGCSQINGMVYARGDRQDYDDWAQMGCDGWSYRDVLPYFKRSESSWAGETEYRGGAGPLGVSISKTPGLQFPAFRAAVRNAGYPVVDDYHDDRPAGIIATELTVDRRGRRANTWRAYVQPVLDRPNLTVLPHALTTRVVFENRRAVGVEYVVKGQKSIVRARREVVLSAGAYGSPQLLMLSGIGPADALRAQGIQPLVDLPGVGQNLVEHPMLYLGFDAKPRTFANELRLDRAVRSWLRWFAFGTGPFASNVCACNIFLHTDPAWNRADIQLGCPAIHMGSSLWAPPFSQPKHGLSLGVIMLRQDSRGHVTLRSANAADAPRIQFNLMQERSDIDRMIRGVRAGREIYAQSPLNELIIQESLPGKLCESDKEIEAFIRQACGITHHPVGTCKMGIDADAVVDPELRVFGVEGLRVADASIMPNVPAGNTNAPAIMVGEKAADLIRGARPRADAVHRTQPAQENSHVH